MAGGHAALERVEAAILHSRDVKYQTAHSDYATRAEHEAMASAGLTPADIASYDAQMSALGQKIAAQKHDAVPADLDTTPYRDTKNMAVLKTKTRDDLPASEFIFPATREFPYEDLAHGRAALRLGGRETPAALEAYSKNPTREAFIDGMLAPLKVAEVNLSRRLLDGAGI